MKFDTLFLRRLTLTGWATLFIAIVCVLAFVPGEWRSVLHSTGDLHPYYHMGAFGVMAWLATRKAKTPEQRVLICTGLALFGCLTEVIEWASYHGVLEWNDMVLDAMGAVLGTSFASLASYFHRQVFFRFQR